MVIAKGKEVKSKQGGGRLSNTENANFILAEDLTLAFTSQFNDLNKSESPSAFKLLSGALKEMGVGWAGFFSGEYEQLGFQMWTGTSPITTSFNIQLSAEKNAEEEVVKPALALARMVLPTAGSKGELTGPGPSIMSALDKGERIGDWEKIHCYIGSFRLENIIIDRAQPTFSKHVDQFGWPIFATVEVSIRTVFTATTNMIDDVITTGGAL